MTEHHPLVDVAGLSIDDRAGRRVIDEVTLHIARGSALGVVGPSGAGKTTVALSLLGEIRPGLRHAAGTVQVGDAQPLALHGRGLRRFRKSQTAWLGQDPAAALTPTMPVAALIAEPLPKTAHYKTRVVAALESVGLPTEHGFLRRLPHQISGGQRRRVALARALVRDPQLLILDEPLAGLDVHSRRTVLTELTQVRQHTDLTLVVISHDVQAMSELTEQLIVLDSGRIVETSDTTTVLTAPASPTASGLVKALLPVPLRPPETDQGQEPVLSARGLSAGFPGQEPVVEHLDFSIRHGEGVALVGASGAGKTTLARTLVGLMPVRVGTITRHSSTSDHAGRVGFVPQDPALALNPARTVAETLKDAIRRAPGQSSYSVDLLLQRVGLDPGLAPRRPDGLSGGQRQRVAIARALAGSPDLLVCDEPTSALDPVVAAGLLDLLNDLRVEGLAILLISHELHNIGRTVNRAYELRDQTLIPLDPDLGGTTLSEADIPRMVKGGTP